MGGVSWENPSAPLVVYFRQVPISFVSFLVHCVSSLSETWSSSLSLENRVIDLFNKDGQCMSRESAIERRGLVGVLFLVD